MMSSSSTNDPRREPSARPPVALPPLTVRQPEAAGRRRRTEAFWKVPGADNERSHSSWFRALQMWGLEALLRAAGVYHRGRRNALDMRLAELEMPLPRLPAALDGLRVLHLSDLHLGRSLPGFAECAQRLLQGIEADVCLLTGDYRYGHFGPSDRAAEDVRRVLSGVRAADGCYAVLGNHDTLVVGEMLEAEGIRVLMNEGVRLALRGETVWLAGVDDPHLHRTADLAAALKGRPEGLFTILLAHSPECVADAARAGVDLYLCGHTHGGQIRLPLLGGVHTNVRSGRRQALGVWREGAMRGHTSAGLGTTDMPVRFLCPPEAALITLRAAPGAG